MPQPDPVATAEALALLQAGSQARAEITDIVRGSVRSEVAAFTGWYSSAEITRFAGILAKLTRAGQRQTALSTDSYAVRILRFLTGRSAPVGAVPVDRLWGGLPMESVYGRLADNYRFLEATRGPSAPVEARLSPVTREPLPQLSQPEILDRVLQRAEVQADTALTLAFREQWVADLDDAPTVTGYRRIFHPELARKSGTCGLCIVASTAVYRREDLLPIHTHCNCGVMPIVGAAEGDGDPGAKVNEIDLDAFYKAAGDSTKAKDLRRTKYAVEQHGELGPVLVYKGDHWKGPKQVAADKAA